ncbi:hypothetical protein TWF694_004549 [Orbilia ellipsospora]|uniref:Uncharacterized protein n=1 Tax=Orbilia ellipsospora TaxID=2528407 RepID=A0AAV9WWH4_9PEZI
MSAQNNNQIGSFTNSSDSSPPLSLSFPLVSIGQNPVNLPIVAADNTPITDGVESAPRINPNTTSQNLVASGTNTGTPNLQCISCGHPTRSAQCFCPPSTQYDSVNHLHRYLESSDDNNSGTDYSLSRYISAGDGEVPWSCVNATLRPVDLSGSVESLSLSDGSFELLEGLELPDVAHDA